MLYRRQGFPEENEIVLCKVTKIFPNSVFVDLLEYNRSGLIHISEIAPGRIRNLREYVTPDRQVVCKVLRIDLEKGHIDLSLRRVNSHERSEKLEEVKQEQKAEQLVKNISKKLKLIPESLYKELMNAVGKKYPSLYLCFRDMAAGNCQLESLGIKSDLAQEISAAVNEKFKPQKIMLKAEIRLQTYVPEGIEKIKNTLAEVGKLSPAISLSYLGAGRYHLVVEEVDYKTAEKHLAKVKEIVDAFQDKSSSASFEREKKD